MSGVVRVAAIGDLHCSRTSQGAFQPLFARIAESADILLIAGDLTDYGLPDEARVLSRELATARMPIVAVLGNHDLESAKGDEIRQILNDAKRVIAEFGIGLASAVFLDAFILRTVLVPAAMHLIGKRNWWLPRGLDRVLPRVAVEGAEA